MEHNKIKEKGKNFKVVLFIVIAIVCVLVYESCTELYGNDIESIQKTITRIYKSKVKVAVFDIKYIGAYKIAGFLQGDSDIDQKIGYVVFKADKRGNYVYKTCSRREVTLRNGTFFDYWFADDNPSTNYYVIVSNNQRLAKVKIDTTDNLNNKHELHEDIKYNPSITLIKIPKNNISNSYYFYDVNGNDIIN